MARINIPLDALTSRLNLQGRFNSVRSQSITARFANLRPISEFLDLKRVSKPRDFGDAQSRINYNLSYFSSNYAVLFVMLSIYSLLTNLLLLFVIVLVVGGMYGIGRLQGRDLDVGFARASSSQLYTGLLIVAVPLGIWASPITTVLWLIGASGVSIMGHAAFCERPIEDSFSGVSGVYSPEFLYVYNTDSHDRRRFRDRSTAHYPSPYNMGRPPGAPSSGRRPQDWEFRQPARYDGRFEVLDSDEDEAQGVHLDANTYAIRDARDRGYAGDELYFDGYDLGQTRPRRRQAFDEFDSEEEDVRQQRGIAYQVAVRDKEEALVQSALERISRARAMGKANVNLSPEEMEALERRPGQPPEPIPSLASPPATPVKGKAKAGSRTNSSTSLTGQKTRRKRSSILGQSTPPSAKSNSKAKIDRKPVPEQALPYPSGAGPPGIMVPGPNGVPVYAPLVYGPPSPEYVRSQPSASESRSRSSSKHSRRESSTTPERIDAAYLHYPPRYYPPSSSMRPRSSSSNRSLPDDIDWYAPMPSARNRSTSNTQYAAYRTSPNTEDYDAPPTLPAAQGRRNANSASSPTDMRYAALRRGQASSSPLTQRPAGPAHANSDPVARRTSGLSRELEESSESSSGEDQGVQVNIVPDAIGSGYSINRAPAARATEGRRRKGGRR